jgi:hypothetical protein
MAVRQDLQDVNQGKYSNVLLLLAVGILLYILIRGWQKTRQQTASDSIGGNINLMLAQQLRTAFIPGGFPVAMGFDGTDVNAVMSLAAQIKDYQAVAQSYRTLYNADLSDDLSQELSVGDLAKFWKIVNGQPTGTTTSPTPTGNTTGTGVVVRMGQEMVVASLVGKTCIAHQAVNVRLYNEPAYSDHLADKDDNLGLYVAEADLTINGSTGRFVHLKKAALWGMYYVDYWVFKSSITFIQ